MSNIKFQTPVEIAFTNLSVPVAGKTTIANCDKPCRYDLLKQARALFLISHAARSRQRLIHGQRGSRVGCATDQLCRHANCSVSRRHGRKNDRPGADLGKIANVNVT